MVEELIEAKSRRSRHGKPASAKYLAGLESRLGKLSRAFQCDLCDVTPENVRKLLDEQNLTSRTHFNHARLLQTFFRFAQGRGYYPKGVDPMEGIDVSFEDDGEIEIFTSEELTRLLNAARPEIIPFLAIAAFAGLRSAELSRLDWEDVWRVPLGRLACSTACNSQQAKHSSQPLAISARENSLPGSLNTASSAGGRGGKGLLCCSEASGAACQYFSQTRLTAAITSHPASNSLPRGPTQLRWRDLSSLPADLPGCIGLTGTSEESPMGLYTHRNLK